MRSETLKVKAGAVLLFAVGLLLQGWAAPVTPDQASAAARNWLRRGYGFERSMGSEIESVRTFAGTNGAACHIAAVKGGGFVVLGSDTEDSPVVAVSPRGRGVLDGRNPLWTLLQRDMAARAQAKAGRRKLLQAAAKAQGARRPSAEERWAKLLAPDEEEGPSRRILLSASNGRTEIADVRVNALVESAWAQTDYRNYGRTSEDDFCYNYYTPNHWPCGCVATAGAQVMRYHAYPTASVEPATYDCAINGDPAKMTMAGGAYDWEAMTLVPAEGCTEAGRKAIGRLTSDVGISVGMSYYSGGASSAAYMLAKRFVDRFQYANAVSVIFQNGFRDGDCPYSLDRLKAALVPNFDAGLPVVLGISGAYGHAVVGDGYGYSDGDFFIHVNLGWANADDGNVWYMPPDIDEYTSIDSIVYNVYPAGAPGASLVSGRVLTADGQPVEGAAVRIVANGKTAAETTSGAKGIYALRASPGEYAVEAEGNGLLGSKRVRIDACVSPKVDEDGSFWDTVCPQIGNVCDKDVTLGVMDGPLPPTVYQISYELDGGENAKANPTSYTTNDLPIALAAPTREGYDFAGWTLGGETVTELGEGMTGDVSLTALWTVAKCKLTLKKAGYTSGASVKPSGSSYKPGKKVSLTATPATESKSKGRERSFFMGWYSDSECTRCVSTENPYKYVIPNQESVKLYAKFAAASELVPVIDCEASCDFVPGVKVSFPVKVTADLPGPVELTLKGLPSGLAFKSGKISGTPKAASKPATVTVTARNEAGKSTREIVFTPVNPGFAVTATAISSGGMPKALEPKEKFKPFVGVPCEIALASEPGLSGRSDYAANGVAVSGLKNGLSFDEKTGVISGVATKTDKQTVTATFTNKWGWKESFKFYIYPQALPEWLVGDYNGIGSYGSSFGTSQLTVSSKGKVSGKIVANGKSYSFSAKSFESHAVTGEETVFSVSAKVNDKYVATFAFVTADGVIGCVMAADGKQKVSLEARQDVWGRKDIGLPAYKNGTVKLTADDLLSLGVVTKSGDSLSVKFSSKGAVKATGKLAGKTISFSSKVIVTEIVEDGKSAEGEVVVPYGKKSVMVKFRWKAGKKPTR